ncbi:phage tail protein [Streptomyces mesophilus]|uniref:phage tail protein n=1 Tax=Streptomyces mesophilus TaxID=1775132 RepID=UPI00331E9FFF
MAGSPGGREVERLSIRVLPDTSGFATSLQTFLDRIEQRAKIAVRVTPDTRGFGAELRDKLGAIQTRVSIPVTPDARTFRTDLQTALASTRARVRVPVEADTSRLAAELRALTGTLDGRIEVAVEPRLNTATLGALATRLERLNRPVRVPILPVLDRAATSRVLSSLERLTRPRQIDLRADLDDGAAQAQLALLTRHRTTTVDVDLDDAAARAQLALLTRDHRITVRVDVDRSGLSRVTSAIGGLGGRGDSAGRPLANVARAIGSVRAAALTAIPNLAGLGAGLVQLAPAAGVAATGLIAMASATAAIKIGTNGVAEALKGDADALAKLAPAAQATVGQLRAMAPAWQGVRSSVQGALFKDLSASLKELGSSVLPVVKIGLTGAATSLNQMARETASAAVTFRGPLGEAMTSANKGLGNLSKAPAVLIQGLVQIGAAAGPAFERLTKGADDALVRLSGKMDRAFNSGSMQASIEGALAQVRQLFDTFGNLGTALGNIFGPAADAGAGFLGVLNTVSQTLADVTGTDAAQEAFRGLFETLASAGRVISGVLGAALQAALPLLSSLVGALAGPLQQAFAAIGPALEILITALGTGLAPVVSAVAGVLADIVPIVADVITMIAGALAPILASLGPVIGQLVSALGTALQPVLAQLPALLAPFLAMATQLAPILVMIATQIISALAPSLAQVGQILAQLLVGLTPLIAAFTTLMVNVLSALMPILTPIIAVVGQLAGLFADVLASAVTNILIPALGLITDLLRGDFSGAWQHAKDLVAGIGKFFRDLFARFGGWVATGINAAVEWLAGLPGRAWSALSEFGPRLRTAAVNGLIKFAAGLRAEWENLKQWFKDLPGNIGKALGDLGKVLIDAGKDLIKGFIDGIKGMLGSVKDTLGGLTDSLTSWKGPPKRDAVLLRPAGRLVMAGFTDGITDAVPDLRARLRAVTDEVAGYRPTVTPRLEAMQPEFTASGDRSGSAVSIGTFVAQQNQSPAAIARELAWLAKARG